MDFILKEKVVYSINYVEILENVHHYSIID